MAHKSRYPCGRPCYMYTILHNPDALPMCWTMACLPLSSYGLSGYAGGTCGDGGLCFGILSAFTSPKLSRDACPQKPTRPKAGSQPA